MRLADRLGDGEVDGEREAALVEVLLLRLRYLLELLDLSVLRERERERREREREQQQVTMQVQLERAGTHLLLDPLAEELVLLHDSRRPGP